MSADAREEALKKAMRTSNLILADNNEALHQMPTDGINVKFSVGEGKARTDKAWLIDFETPENKMRFWLSINLRLSKITSTSVRISFFHRVYRNAD